ncbi:MAG: hypothetical protein ACI9HI_002404 [Salinirussus sp.]|jgi:hypothetical protein
MLLPSPARSPPLEDSQKPRNFDQRYFDAYSEAPTGFTLDTVAGWDALKQAGDQAGTVERVRFVVRSNG